MILTNAELMLMQVIEQSPNKTGYEINKIVQMLGYHRWAGVGKTSVYNGLNKLITKEFVTARINAEKKGKGPLPTCYNATTKGSEILKLDMLETIKTSRERDQRFDLTISAIHLLSKTEITTAFSTRNEFLNQEYERLTKEYEVQKDCIPDGGKLLYKRMILSLENELKFSELILQNYNK